MRYTKVALLIFGVGLVLGFIIVVGEFPRWERVASLIMAAGLALLPVGLFADGHGMRLVAWFAGRWSRRTRKQPRGKSRAAPRRRKPPQRTAARSPRRKRT